MLGWKERSRGARRAGLAKVVGTGVITGSLVLGATTGAWAATSVNAQVAKWEKRPTHIGVTVSPGPIPKKKTIAFVECSIQACVILGQYLKDATDALGWNLKIINAGSGANPSTVSNAWTQAVNLHPTAVIGTGFPRSIMNKQISQLAAAKIPVIMGSVATTPGNGITATINSIPSFTLYGKAMADYTTSKMGSSTSTHTLFVNTPGFPIVGTEYDGFKAEFGKVCSSCDLQTLTIPNADIGTSQVGSAVVGYLQSHHTVNALAVGFATVANGLPQALTAAGMANNIKVMVTQDTTQPYLGYIKANTLGAATVEENWQEWMWRAVDLVIRKLNHKSIKPDTNATTVPLWIVNQQSAKGQSTLDTSVPTYETQFKKLWGVKKK